MCHRSISRRLLPGGKVARARRPARHVAEAATVRHRVLRRKAHEGGNMSASGVDKAKRKRRLGLLRIRGRQNPQTQSPQTRTMGRGEKRVLAGDGGYGSRGVDRRRRRIPGREAISRGQGAERGEEPKKRARDTMAPLSNKTQLSTYPQIPQEFPTGYVS